MLYVLEERRSYHSIFTFVESETLKKLARISWSNAVSWLLGTTKATQENLYLGSTQQGSIRIYTLIFLGLITIQTKRLVDFKDLLFSFVLFFIHFSHLLFSSKNGETLSF